MNNYINNLSLAYYQNANYEYAILMSKYMKNRFPFFGMQSSLREELNRAFIANNGLPDYSEAKQMAVELFKLPEREFHYFAILMLTKLKKYWKAEDVQLWENLLTTNSWWDSVDYIIGSVLGEFFQKYPELIIPVTDKWAGNENIWLKRSSILFQLKYKSKTDLELLSRHILQNNQSKEFFVQKAIGWALREYSKTDAKWVEWFVASNELKPLSKREALKRIEKQNSK